MNTFVAHNPYVQLMLLVLIRTTEKSWASVHMEPILRHLFTSVADAGGKSGLLNMIILKLK